MLQSRAEAWGEADLALLAEVADRLAPEAAAIAQEWAEQLLGRSALLAGHPEALERITELNRWFLEGHLLQLRERDVEAVFRTNFDGDVALLRTQASAGPEIRSTLAELYLSLEVSTGVIFERLRRLFAGDERLPRVLATYSRLALQLAETVGLAFHEVRTVELEGALRAASSLLESARELNRRAVSLPAVLENLTGMAARLLRCEKSLVFLWDEGERAYRCAAHRGFSEEDFAELRRLPFRAGAFPVADALLAGEVRGGLSDDGQVPRPIMERYGVEAYGAAPMTAADGRPLGAVAVYRRSASPFDETDLRIVEGIAKNAALAIENAELVERLEAQAAELRRSNDELEAFAYVASHDLQEPLRTVAGFVQLLGRRYAGRLDAEADEFIRFAVGGVERMQTLIRDLLAYSRVGRSSAELASVDAGALVDETVRDLGTAVAESGAAITHDPLPTVVADAAQLRQVFQNLIGNAIKFRGASPPRVHVSAQRNREGWQFTVTDNGIGIDPRYADRLFLLFQRLHRQEDYPGTGIGLAICKKIVERHGGRIGFRPAAGGGSTFFFTLPKQRARP
jgi:signal transduction histidine kinase